MAGVLGQAVVVAIVALILQLVVLSLATVYTVGDTNGWAMGVNYSTWTSDKMFLVGDSLGESFTTHSLRRRTHMDEVSKSDYSSCTVGNVISTESSGSITISLKTEGTHYFICVAMGHYGSGMKLTITVKSSSSSAGTTPSTSPTGTDTTATLTSSTTTPTTTTPTTTTTSSYKPEADFTTTSSYKLEADSTGRMMGLVLMAGVLFRGIK